MSQPERHTLEVDDVGVVVHEQVLGDGGPTVLLLHGNPDSHSLWRGTLAELEERGVGARCLLPDMPGFGASPPPPADFDYREAHTVPLWQGVLDQLGVNEPVIVVAHDFGGPWLLPWVIAHPERVAGVVLANTLFSPGYRWHFWARVWQTPVLGELAGISSPRALFRWEMRKGSKGLPLAYCDEAHAGAIPSMRRCVLRTYRAHADPSEVFKALHPAWLALAPTLPVRVLHGTRDPYLPVGEAESFGVPITRLDDAGHWSPVERPDAVAQAIVEVLAG